jgi:hypothetical protein
LFQFIKYPISSDINFDHIKVQVTKYINDLRERALKMIGKENDNMNNTEELIQEYKQFRESTNQRNALTNAVRTTYSESDITTAEFELIRQYVDKIESPQALNTQIEALCNTVKFNRAFQFAHMPDDMVKTKIRLAYQMCKDFSDIRNVQAAPVYETPQQLPEIIQPIEDKTTFEDYSNIQTSVEIQNKLGENKTEEYGIEDERRGNINEDERRGNRTEEMIRGGKKQSKEKIKKK